MLVNNPVKSQAGTAGARKLWRGHAPAVVRQVDRCSKEADVLRTLLGLKAVCQADGLQVPPEQARATGALSSKSEESGAVALQDEPASSAAGSS